MRTLGSQPLPRQTCPKQVRAQVSSHAFPGPSHCFLSLCTPQIFALWVPDNAPRTPLRNNAIALQQVLLRFNAHSAGTVEAV